MIEYKIAEPKDFSRIAKFVVEHNQLPTEHCLHCGQNYEEVFGELQDFHSRKEERFILAFDEEELVGLFGGDSDNDPLTEIWLWGPFVAKNASPNLKQQLYEELLKTFPTVKKMTAFYRLENVKDKKFYAEQGFKEKKEATHDYRCKKGACPSSLLKADASIIPFETDYLAELKELHELAFPKTYYTIDEILNLKNLQNEKYQLWIQRDTANQLVAYVFANITPNGEGYVHYLAVHPDHRKKGIGSLLLQRALYFFFVENTLPLVSLTVSDTNNARRLYEKHGFSLSFSGKGAFWKK